MTGIIKTFLNEKQYGFIKGDDGKDYFFHQSKLKDKNDVHKICEDLLVTFEQKATPKGYNAVNIELTLKEENIGYMVPDTIYTSKNSNIKGWETIELADWMVHGSSRDSPDSAKREMLENANYVDANAVFEMEYYKTTGSESGTGNGTYYFTIHNFKGRIANIAKKKFNGSYTEEELTGLNENAYNLKTKLIAMTESAKNKRLFFWLFLFIIIGMVWLIKAEIAIIATIGVLFVGFILSHANDYDSWLEPI